VSRIEPMAEAAGTQSMTLAIRKLRIEEGTKGSGRGETAAKQGGGGEGAIDVETAAKQGGGGGGAIDVETESDDEFVAGAVDSDNEAGEKGMGSSSK
jgi:hypothetical protein